MVTGASRGIGRHIAIALAGRGMDLVVAARPTHLAAPFRTVADRGSYDGHPLRRMNTPSAVTVGPETPAI